MLALVISCIRLHPFRENGAIAFGLCLGAGHCPCGCHATPGVQAARVGKHYLRAGIAYQHLELPKLVEFDKQ